MKYITYILLNSDKTKTYTGHTDDLVRRMKEHNSGRSTFTSKYGPWVLFKMLEFDTLQEAINKEKYFKSTTGRRELAKMMTSVNI